MEELLSCKQVVPGSNPGAGSIKGAINNFDISLMTVSELIAELTALPPQASDHEVIVWHDEEAYPIFFFQASAESGPTIFTVSDDGSDPLA